MVKTVVINYDLKLKFKFLVGNYGFDFFKMIKTVVTNHGFNFKLKAIVGDYDFNHLKKNKKSKP